MTPALVCGKHLLDLDHGLLRDITFSQHSAGVGWLSDSLGVSDAPRVPPDRPRSGIGKDRPDYIVVTGEWGGRPHLRDPWRSRQSALVLVDDRQRSDDALGSRGDVRRAKAQFQKSWDAWKA